MGWVVFLIVACAIGLWLAFRPARQPAKVDLSFLPAQFVVFDLETTGLNPDKNKIIEIGAIKVNRDSNHHDTFQALIKIKGAVPAKITEITGITKAMLDTDGDAIEVALPKFLEFIGDLRLVSFNAPFDMGFLNVTATAQDMRVTNPVSCALDMARRAWPGLKSYKLANLAKAGNMGTQNHRAMSDCQLAATVYMAAANKLKRAA